MNKSKCSTSYEIISKLRKPIIGAFNLWDFVYGDQDFKERMVEMIPKPESLSMIGVGERYSYEDGVKKLLIVELTPRGRIAWEKIHSVDDLVHVNGIAQHEDRYIVVGTKEKKNDQTFIWIGFFDLQGEIVSQKEIASDRFALRARSFTHSYDKKNLILASQAEPYDFSLPPYTIVYQLNGKGQVVWSRSFLIGIESEASEITQLGEESYLLSGYTKTYAGRKAAWIMRLNDEGGIVWQRQYGRGNGATFMDVKAYGDNYFAAIGHVAPITSSGDGGRKIGAWVMMADASSGNVAWQRYYREDFDLLGRAIETSSDGTISALIDAINPENEDDKEFVRLVGLNPRGFILESSAFYNGVGAGANGLTFGINDSRVIFGHSDVEFTIEDGGESGQSNLKQVIQEKKRSQQGWVLAAPAPDRYEDPCKNPLPILP